MQGAAAPALDMVSVVQWALFGGSAMWIRYGACIALLLGCSSAEEAPVEQAEEVVVRGGTLATGSGGALKISMYLAAGTNERTRETRFVHLKAQRGSRSFDTNSCFVMGDHLRGAARATPWVSCLLQNEQGALSFQLKEDETRDGVGFVLQIEEGSETTGPEYAILTGGIAGEQFLKQTRRGTDPSKDPFALSKMVDSALATGPDALIAPGTRIDGSKADGFRFVLKQGMTMDVFAQWEGEENPSTKANEISIQKTERLRDGYLSASEMVAKVKTAFAGPFGGS